MSKSIYKESYRQLLGSMANIAIEMPEIILLNYYDKLGNQNKYLLSLFNESYKSALIVCESLKNGCISQAAVILRLLLESASLIRVLTLYPELLEKYIKHFKVRLEISHNPEKERSILETEFPDVDSNKRLSYMDYGWFESKLQPSIKNGKLQVPQPKETELIKLAGFNDLISWKKEFLDKLSHQSFMMENMVDENHEIPLAVRFIEILCKLFDYICCDFHTLTGFDFIINGEDKFQGEFKKIYKQEDFK